MDKVYALFSYLREVISGIFEKQPVRDKVTANNNSAPVVINNYNININVTPSLECAPLVDRPEQPQNKNEQ